MMMQARAYVSKKDSPNMIRLSPAVAFVPEDTHEIHVIDIYPERQYQTILGFGGAFTETAAYNFAKLSDEHKQTVIAACFDPHTGNQYNMCRTHIQSCDFALDSYTYMDDGDEALKTFTIERDHRYILPYLKSALQTAPELLLFASPWSPPAWMKSNRDIRNGGSLLERYYQTWADCFVKYLAAYQEQGVRFFGVTVQNEAMANQTWESCVYTAREEGRFAHEYLRPTLDAAGFTDVKIMIWDHNKERVFDRARDTFQVPGARDDIWGIAFHWYSGDHFDSLRMTHEAFPDKPLLLTEYCMGVSRGGGLPLPHSDWHGVEEYARELIGDFNNYMAAATDWNLIVDETGGPFHDRQAGCKAQIVANHEEGTISFEPIFYALGHFSRFICRGSKRIGSSVFGPDIQAAAFQNPSGQIILVALNTGSSNYSAYLRLRGETANVAIEAKSLITYTIDP